MMYLTISAFDGCLYGRDSRWNITWANTARNTIDTQPCPGGVESRGIMNGLCAILPTPPPPLKLETLYWITAGTATRLCMMDGNWADPDVLECESQQFLQLLSEVTSKQPCNSKK